MLNLTFTARLALARAQANPGLPVPVVTSTTPPNTTDTSTATDALPAAENDGISDEVDDRFFDASPEDFSTIEVGRSAPPPSNNNDSNNDGQEDAFYNANDEFVGPSWWYDGQEEEDGNDVGNDDEGYFWSDDEGAVDPQASLYAEQEDLRAAVIASGDGENDENAVPLAASRPIAPLRRRARVARNSTAGNVPPPSANPPAPKAHVAPADSLRASVVANHVASEPTVGSDCVSAPVSAPCKNEVKPVVSGVATAPIIAISVEPITVAASDIIPVGPITANPVIDEDDLMPLAGPISAPAIIVPPHADVSTDNCSLEDMDIDGPDFLDHNDDPMDVDWFAPCLAREFAKILGLGRRSGVSSGRSLPGSVANPRSSVRLGVRSARFGARVAGKRVPSVRVAVSRRLALVSGRK